MGLAPSSIGCASSHLNLQLLIHGFRLPKLGQLFLPTMWIVSSPCYRLPNKIFAKMISLLARMPGADILHACALLWRICTQILQVQSIWLIWRWTFIGWDTLRTVPLQNICLAEHILFKGTFYAHSKR